MKKIISIVIVSIMLCLCGCSNGTSQPGNGGPAGEPIKGDYLGYWEHTEYPDSYSVVVYEQTRDSLGFVVLADRVNASGMVMQMASVRQENVKAGSGDTHFKFRDSFGNSGLCRLQLTSDQLTFTFNVTGGYQGNWCIDAGNGSYKKTKELSELDWFNKDDYELIDFNEEIDYEKWGLENAKPVEDKSYVWYGKYYLAGNDLEHDRSNYYSFAGDGTSIGDVTQCSYSRTTEGKFYQFESDRPDYDFRILFRLDNGEEFLLYGKSNIPKNDSRRHQQDDITFYMYSTNGNISFYGRYSNETYIGTESAVRAANR